MFLRYVCLSSHGYLYVFSTAVLPGRCSGSSLAGLLRLSSWHGCPLLLHCYYCPLCMAYLSCGRPPGMAVLSCLHCLRLSSWHGFPLLPALFTAVLLAWLSSLACIVFGCPPGIAVLSCLHCLRLSSWHSCPLLPALFTAVLLA
jgi:hypothetical protein